MALKKALSHPLLHIHRLSNQSIRNCRISSSVVHPGSSSVSHKTNIAPPDPGDTGIFRRFLHKTSVFRPDIGSFAFGENLMAKIKSMGIGGERIRLDGLTDSLAASDQTRLTADDARKVLRVAHLETVKWRLREVGKIWITYAEFIRICGQGCSDPDSVLKLAKTLDESGTVIVLGNLVVLRPEQVAKAMEDLIPMAGEDDPRRMELEEMESQKGAIDSKAELLVRRELWCGLGFLALQTMALMRLTFWELSWDVMEPICFYLTSLYFMASYGFFLATSIEPSFQGFFQTRFSSKQTRLIKLHNFDIARYNHLRRIYYHNHSSSNPGCSSTFSILFGTRENIHLGGFSQ